MNEIVKELMGSPELIQEMLANAGKMSLALMANKLREVERENKLLQTQISETNGQLRDAHRNINELNEKAKRLQEVCFRKIELVQNQVDELKKPSSQQNRNG